MLRDRLEFLLLEVKVQPCHTAGVLSLKKETIAMIRTRAWRKRALRTPTNESTEETLARQEEEERVRLLFEAMMATITSKNKRKKKSTDAAAANQQNRLTRARCMSYRRRRSRGF